MPESAREGFLRRFPVELLPVSAGARRRLETFGLRTLGDLARLPQSALLAQFGPEGRRLWLLARGRDEEPVRPREAPPEVVETLNFAAPEAVLDALLIGVRELLERVLRRPERQGRGVRQLRLDALLENGQTWVQVVTVRQPGTLPEALFPPLRYRLERVRPPAAVESLTLSLTELTASLGGQQALFPEPQGERLARLEEELRQLRARLGRPAVARIVGVEPWSRIPERRYQLLSYDP